MHHSNAKYAFKSIFENEISNIVNLCSNQNILFRFHYCYTLFSWNKLHSIRIKEVEVDDKKQWTKKFQRLFCYLRHADENVTNILSNFTRICMVKWKSFLFCFAENDETATAQTISSNPTVDCDGEESRFKCTDLRTDDSSSVSNTQSSYTSFATTVENSIDNNYDSTEMR